MCSKSRIRIRIRTPSSKRVRISDPVRNPMFDLCFRHIQRTRKKPLFVTFSMRVSDEVFRPILNNRSIFCEIFGLAMPFYYCWFLQGGGVFLSSHNNIHDTHRGLCNGSEIGGSRKRELFVPWKMLRGHRI
jgi:hypothetical protein